MIKAHQKIAELEQKVRQTAQATPIVKKEPAVIVQQPAVTRLNNTKLEPAVQVNRNFPTKEMFLQSNRQTRSVAETDGERPTVTLAIEEMLDCVSEKRFLCQDSEQKKSKELLCN